VVSELKNADGWTDMTSPLCIHCMNFMQRMQKNYQHKHKGFTYRELPANTVNPSI